MFHLWNVIWIFTGWSTYFCASCLLVLVIKQGVTCYFAHQTFRKLKIPGPTPKLFLGNYSQVRAQGTLPYLVLGEWIKKYGNVFGFYMGPNPILVINDVDIVKEIMVRKFKNFHRRPPLIIPAKPIVDSTLDTVGIRWKSVRAHLSPLFTSAKLKGMSSAIEGNADEFVNLLQDTAQSGKSIDILEKCQALTLKIVCESMLAIEVNCLQNPKDEFLRTMRNFILFSMNPVINLAIFFPPLARILAFINNYVTCGRLTNIIIDNLKHVLELRRLNASERRNDMLQFMLDAQADTSDEAKSKIPLTDTDIIANSHLSLMASYETVSLALSLTFYLLSLHEDIQDRVHEEITTKLGGKTKPSFEDVKCFTYLEQVVYESLRLYPPTVMFMQRMSDQDCVIGDIKIPKGVTVHFPIWQIHRDPNLWAEPDKFNPDRFAPENKDSLNSGAFLTFGLGPRNCLGIKFAMFELKMAIAKVLLRFRVVPTKETEVPLQFTCKAVTNNPKNGIKVKFVERE